MRHASSFPRGNAPLRSNSDALTPTRTRTHCTIGVRYILVPCLERCVPPPVLPPAPQMYM